MRGQHTLYLRTQNVNGVWSITSNREINVINYPAYRTAPDTASNIVAAEYFFDLDPGFGQGTAIPVNAGQDITVTGLNPNTSNLSAGQHIKLCVVKSMKKLP